MACSSKRRPNVNGYFTLPPANGYTWSEELKSENFLTPPLSAFKHVPLSLSTTSIQPGLVVEVANPFAKGYITGEVEPFWQASIVKVLGYKVLLRLHSNEEKLCHEFWSHIASGTVQSVGWCLANKIDLVPPEDNSLNLEELRIFLLDKLAGKKTLDKTEVNFAFNSNASVFEKGKVLEIVDPNMLEVVRVGVILDIIGNRIKIGYFDGENKKETVWYNERSQFIHPVGWANKLEIDYVASSSYRDRVSRGEFLDRDCFWDMFAQYAVPADLPAVGMKLEAVNLRRPDKICVATVKKVLRFGYLVISIDGNLTEDQWFFSHTSSPLIFPPGFCHKFSISLSYPSHIKGFSWSKYLRDTESLAVPSKCLNQRTTSSNQFQVGMVIEAASISYPGVLEVATIVQTASRLVKLRFNTGKNEIWMDCESPDLYPVGWAEYTGFELIKPDLKEPSRSKMNHPAKELNRYPTRSVADKKVDSVVPESKESPSIENIEITFESSEDCDVAVPAVQTEENLNYLVKSAQYEESSLTSPKIQIFKLDKILDEETGSSLSDSPLPQERGATERRDSTSYEIVKDDILSDDICLLVPNAISDEVLGDSVAGSPIKTTPYHLNESEDTNDGKKRKLPSERSHSISLQKRGRLRKPFSEPKSQV